MTSKRILQRDKSLRILESVFRVGWPEARAALRKILAGELGGEEDLDRLPEALLARLRRLMGALLQADSDVSSLAGAESARNQEMRKAGEVLRRMLLMIKRPLQLSYGASFEAVFPDLKSHVLRRDPDRLLRLSEIALDRILNPDPGVPMLEAFKRMNMWEPQEYEGHLRRALEPFQAAHAEHEAVRNRLAAARVDRDRLYDEYNTTFPDTAGYLVHLFRTAGLPHWAEKLVPSGQEPGLLLSETKQRRNRRAAATKGKKSVDDASSAVEEALGAPSA